MCILKVCVCWEPRGDDSVVGPAGFGSTTRVFLGQRFVFHGPHHKELLDLGCWLVIMFALARIEGVCFQPGRECVSPYFGKEALASKWRRR